MVSRVTIFIILSVFVCVLCKIQRPKRWLHRGRTVDGFVPRPEPKSKRIVKAIEYAYDQRIDHFSNDTRIFKQRYFYTDYFYKTGGAAFILIEGEGPASSKWIEYMGFPMMKMAQDHNAIVFVLEHRFYGESQPFDTLATANLQYLSSEQALEDTADFIRAMTIKHNLNGAKWITFGGSYSGSLSAWMRLKYPHVVWGAVASSAPVFAEVDFPEYMEVVQTALTEYDKVCADNVQKGFAKVRQLMQTAAGRQTLRDTFKLCDSLEVSNEDDIAVFYESLIDPYAVIVQYNRDNAGHFRDALTVEKICSFHLDESVDPVVQLGNANAYVMPYFGEECIDFNYQDGLRAMKNISIYSDYAASRAWYWQTCTEFGYYQTTNSPTAGSFFGNVTSLRYYTQQCEQIYGSQYNEGYINAKVNATNQYYGGRDNYVGMRVVFPNGSWDPWHTLGILASKFPLYTAVYMKGTSHCADMYEPLDDDLDSLKTGRETIELQVATWLNA